MTKVYLYVCDAHARLGEYDRPLSAVENEFFDSEAARTTHLHYCQVKGCQFRRQWVIQVNFTRKNETLELREPKEVPEWP